MLRTICHLVLMILAAQIAVGCQPLIVESAPLEIEIPTESTIIDGVGPSSASDPEQARAEDEFLAVAMAKERAFYDGDVDALLSFYADDIVSTLPGLPEVSGKDDFAEGLHDYLGNNDIVGTLTIKRITVDGDHATRQAEWEEVMTPNDGSEPQHYVGRCTLEWEKIDGEWKVVSEFINYLEPPTGIQ